MSTPTIRAALDAAEQFATGEVWAGHPLAIILEALVKQTRAVLDAEPVGGEPSERIVSIAKAVQGCAHTWEPDALLIGNVCAQDVADLCDAVIDRWARPAAPAAPEAPAEALAARPLLEQVARLGDCIGANTVGQIMATSDRAAAWLRENPPGQPVAIEPRGCPTPGACSCVEPAPAAPEVGEVGELVDRLGWIAAQLGDIGWSVDSASVARAAALLQQPPAPAPAVVPAAVSEWEDGFMGGVCVALATAKAHGADVIWREIVKSVGVDNALNYAANVNPEDWDLAGFSEYAQIELGKGKPLPLSQVAEPQP